jgi:hypothetical protein
MRDGGGVGWEPSALADIATELRTGAKDLGDVANSAPPAPDAGVSSEIVGQTLATLVTAGATAAAVLETTAGKISASLGAYESTEKSNTDTVDRVNDTGPGYLAERAPR